MSENAGIKTVNAARREIEAVLTHEGVDATGEVVRARGVQWTRWQRNRNPKMLWAHGPEADIGSWDAASLRLVHLDGAEGWIARGHLYPPGVSALADDVHAKLQHGSMGTSIGFLSLRQGPPIVPNQRGVTHEEVEIVEASLVNLPACPSCMVLEKDARAMVVKHCQHQPRVIASIADLERHFLRTPEPQPRLTVADLARPEVLATVKTAMATTLREIVTESVRQSILRLKGRVD